METFNLEQAGKHYIESVKKNCSWEVRINHKEGVLEIIERGSILQCIVLTVKADNMVVQDWWGWGEG